MLVDRTTHKASTTVTGSPQPAGAPSNLMLRVARNKNFHGNALNYFSMLPHIYETVQAGDKKAKQNNEKMFMGCLWPPGHLFAS